MIEITPVLIVMMNHLCCIRYHAPNPKAKWILRGREVSDDSSVPMIVRVVLVRHDFGQFSTFYTFQVIPLSVRELWFGIRASPLHQWCLRLLSTIGAEEYRIVQVVVIRAVLLLTYRAGNLHRDGPARRWMRKVPCARRVGSTTNSE